MLTGTSESVALGRGWDITGSKVICNGSLLFSPLLFICSVCFIASLLSP